MAIAIFLADANPAVDQPLFFADRERYQFMLSIGAIRQIKAPNHKRAAQYCGNTATHIPHRVVYVEPKPLNPGSLKYPVMVWVGCGGGAGNLRYTYGDAARKFRQTRQWRFAPNETTSPYEHRYRF